MYARVARWEGADAEQLRGTAEKIGSQSGPPPGVPAKGFTMLVDPESGTSLAIALFETEEDMQTGDAALNAMNPQGGGQSGKRVSVEMYEVAADIRL